MGLLNALLKAGCNHAWGPWRAYDFKTNDVNTLSGMFISQERLRACYEVRRCNKCPGYETRWVHDWRYDQESVEAQRRYEQKHGNFGTGGPTLMMECRRCGKRDPFYAVMGD